MSVLAFRATPLTHASHAGASNLGGCIRPSPCAGSRRRSRPASGRFRQSQFHSPVGAGRRRSRRAKSSSTAPSDARLLRPLVGVDLGVKHLATLSVPVGGVSDKNGHVADPKHLDAELQRLAKLDRQLARCAKGSKNRIKILKRRQLLFGLVTRTRDLYLHGLTTTLAGNFETVVLEDLGVVGMVKKKTSNTANKILSRSILDAGFYEVRRQLTYKAEDRHHRVVVIDRFYPSSKKCSHCGETRAKLDLRERVFECSTCGISLDRDVNAACNIHREGLLRLSNEVSTVAGHKPETINAVSRDHETEPPWWGRGHRYQSRTTQSSPDSSRTT